MVAALAVVVVALLAGGLAVATQHGATSSLGPCSPGGGSCTSSSTAGATTPTSTVSSSGTSTYTILAQTATTVSDPMNGLELRLYLNTTSSFAAGTIVGFFADAYNPSSSTANVTYANHWVVPLNGTNGAVCGDNGQIVGFAIAKGYYTSANVTAAKLLDLVNPAVMYSGCLGYFGYGDPTGFLFQPMSDGGASYGCITPTRPNGLPACLTGNATATYAPQPVTVTGYWSKGGTFTSFPSGTYTVLAEDEWGALALAYFSSP